LDGLFVGGDDPNERGVDGFYGEGVLREAERE